MKILDVPQSGSIAGSTSSRNRFGQYRRSRAIPVNPNTTAQDAARVRLSDSAAAWRTLTSDQRAGWGSLGALMVRTDSLGQTYSLTGFQAYVSVNNANAAAGNATVSDAPALGAPDVASTVTLTLTSAAFSVAYTPTPFAAGARGFIYASPQRSAGRAFEGDYRLIAVTAAAAASPANILAAYTAKFGVPVTGNRIFVAVRTYLGGFMSAALSKSQVVA